MICRVLLRDSGKQEQVRRIGSIGDQDGNATELWELGTSSESNRSELLLSGHDDGMSYGSG